MVSSVGLAAAYPGYQAARQADQKIQATDVELENQAIEQQGNEALGRTIMAFQSMIPGAQPMGGGAQPPAPMPGQPSQPRPSVATPPQMQSPGFQPGPVNAPPQMQSPGFQPPQVPPTQAQPQMPAAAQGLPGAQGGIESLRGRLDLKQLMGAVAQANPGAKPAVIAAAVTKALPLLNAQAQQDWKQMSLMLASRRADIAGDRVDIAAGEADRKRDQGDRRLEQGGQRIEQGQVRLDQSGRNVNSAIQRRSDQTDLDRDRVNQGNRRIDQGAQRIDQGQQRIDTTRQQGERRLEQGETRLQQQGGEFASRDTRRREQTVQGEKRIEQAGARETRMAAQGQIRQDQRWAALEQQKAALEERIRSGDRRASVSEWRAIVDAQHKRAMEIIQSASINSNLRPEERKKLLDEQNKFYTDQIKNMKPGAQPPPAPGGAKVQDRVVPGGAGAAPAPQQPQTRPRAKNPKTGEEVEFDGTNWVPVAAAPPMP